LVYSANYHLRILQPQSAGCKIGLLEVTVSHRRDLIPTREYRKPSQETYVENNIEARTYKHCCSGKLISVKYSDSVFVALGIQHASSCKILLPVTGPLY
jgi:hypothetical protein